MTHADTLPAVPDPAVRLLSVIQAAEVLSCSTKHVYRLIASGELPAVDIAQPGAGISKTRIREADLLAYLNRAALH